MVESIFIINLFGDTNVAHIFYESSQTYGTKKNDNYLGTERVLYYCIMMVMVIILRLQCGQNLVLVCQHMHMT
jgi:hypothetical protein